MVKYRKEKNESLDLPKISLDLVDISTPDFNLKDGMTKDLVIQSEVSEITIDFYNH